MSETVREVGCRKYSLQPSSEIIDVTKGHHPPQAPYPTSHATLISPAINNHPFLFFPRNWQLINAHPLPPSNQVHTSHHYHHHLHPTLTTLTDHHHHQDHHSPPHQLLPSSTHNVLLSLQDPTQRRLHLQNRPVHPHPQLGGRCSDNTLSLQVLQASLWDKLRTHSQGCLGCFLVQ